MTHDAGNSPLPQFVVGQDYNRRQEIHEQYGGNWQSGISSSRTSPAIFLFTSESGAQYGYQDGFDPSGVFSYTGEGQIGDMTFRGGNLAIRDHAKDGKSLHLFSSLGKGKPVRYLGEFSLANYSFRRGHDRQGDDREVIVFHLLRVASEQEAPPQIAETAPSSLIEARKRALQACATTSGLAGDQAVRTVYARSKAIRDYVLLRARGQCEACGAAAPFLGVDGRPYLEAHHTTRLSDGGIDHPRYVAALCPTCHRQVHYGQDGSQVNAKLGAKLLALESKD